MVEIAFLPLTLTNSLCDGYKKVSSSAFGGWKKIPVLFFVVGRRQKTIIGMIIFLPFIFKGILAQMVGKIFLFCFRWWEEDKRQLWRFHTGWSLCLFVKAQV